MTMHRHVVAATTLSILLLAIAEGCGTVREEEDRTCPKPDVYSMTPQAFCSTVSDESTSISNGSLVRPNQPACTIEQTFLDRFREANPHLFPSGAPIGAVDGGGDVELSDADLSDALTADATTRDAAPDSSDAGAVDAKAPKVINCPSFDRNIVLTCAYECQFGRPFEGFEHTDDGLDGVRGFFAACARTEAASVDAFLILADELGALGAPASLVRACEEAARDERSHAETMSKLAGIDTVSIAAPPRAKRSALAIAVENARSGLVVETFAALLNHVQSLRAPSVDLRARLAEVAADETRHAELSRRIHLFISATLSDAERCVVEAERLAAIADLEAAIRRTMPSPMDAEVGLPPRGQRLALLDQLKRRVWALDEITSAA